MKRSATKSALLVAFILTFLFFWGTTRTHITQVRKQKVTSKESVPTKTRSNQTATASKPDWTIGYEKEFWHKAVAAKNISSNLPALNVQEIVDRVSHAFRAAEGGAPKVSGRDYSACLEGASLHFTPKTGEESEIGLNITTTSAAIGENKFYSASSSASKAPTDCVGNTAQTILEPTTAFVQHVEARAHGVELTWILEHRPDTKGVLRIEADFDGLEFAGESGEGFHFADASGMPRVRIGNATLVDSAGNRAAVPTQVVDSRFVVQVPADLLATAAYPIAIDPLISAEFGMDRAVSATFGGEDAKVASNGADYLVIWHDWRSNYDVDIYAARVSRDGWILDPNGIGIRVGNAGQDKFAVASNGSDYLIVWTEFGSAIMGARLASDGKLLDPDAFLVAQSPLFPSNLSVAGNGDNYLVLWRDNRDHRFDLYGGVVRASDRHVTDTSGTKLVEDSYMGTAAAIAPHLDGFVAVWRNSQQIDGAMYRIQQGAIVKIAGLALPTLGGNSPSIASGPGGILLAWEDGSVADPSSKLNIYGRLLSPTGQPNSATFPICAAPYNQTHPTVAANSSGFIVAWQDNRRGAGLELTNDVYVARVANNGDVTPTNGQLITPEPTNDADRQNQTLPDIASNGDQSLVVWTDITSDLMESVRSARIGADGTVLDPRGLPVTAGTINAQHNAVVAANSDGFLVAWVDQRNGADIYGARFTRDGHILDPTGIAISTARASQNSLALTSNGSDYFAIWSDSRDYAQNFGFDIYGARVSGAGVVIDPNGILINGGPGYDFRPKAASDGTNYIAVWERLENSDSHVYSRLIRSSGDPVPSGATQIKGVFRSQVYPNIASNGREYIVAWTDGDADEADAYGQRLDHDGAHIGGNFPICTLPKRQVAPLIASNGDGYFVTWLDGNYDASNFDPQTMFGTRLGSNGQVLDNPPILIQPTSHYYIQRALASDGRDYVVLWQIQDGPIQGVRISAAGEHLGDSFVVAPGARDFNQPSVAATGGKYLVAYTTSNTPGNFSRIRGRTLEFNLPEPWREIDVGYTPTPGGAGYKDGVFTIQGSGGTSAGGAFHYMYQTFDGDGQIVARLKDFSTPDSAGRVGLMIRGTTDESSPFAFIGFSGTTQTIFTRRRTPFGETRYHIGDPSPLPTWFKLIRAGELILAYTSQDGITWQRFDTSFIDFSPKILVGLAISSGSDLLASAQLDQVSVWSFQTPIDQPPAPTLKIGNSASDPISEFITLHLTSDGGAILQLETSTDLSNWSLLQNVTNTANGSSITIPQSSDETLRFYRLAPTD